MLKIEMSVVDTSGSDRIAKLKIVRGTPHHRIKGAYWYEYQAEVVYLDGDSKVFVGSLVHSYRNGAVSLAQKVLKAVRKLETQSKNEGV